MVTDSLAVRGPDRSLRESLVVVEERSVVFVIDDDPSMRAALEDLVSTVGLEVRAFAAPQEFLQSEPQDTERLAELRELFATLTERERQIMALVVIGRANKQIAAELNLSEMTVKVHRRQVIRKLGAGSLPELVRMADRLGEPIARS
jgi:RNA polymerase sigma factor (sigma-70 family)